eukprot:10957645-Alexandrium_andersonii.AAC.1
MHGRKSVPQVSSWVVCGAERLREVQFAQRVDVCSQRRWSAMHSPRSDRYGSGHRLLAADSNS